MEEVLQNERFCKRKLKLDIEPFANCTFLIFEKNYLYKFTPAFVGGGFVIFLLIVEQQFKIKRFSCALFLLL